MAATDFCIYTICLFNGGLQEITHDAIADKEHNAAVEDDILPAFHFFCPILYISHRASQEDSAQRHKQQEEYRMEPKCFPQIKPHQCKAHAGGAAPWALQAGELMEGTGNSESCKFDKDAI